MFAGLIDNGGLNGHGKLVSIILLGLTFFYRLLCIRQRLEVVVVE
jgi:hypothetical protein